MAINNCLFKRVYQNFTTKCCVVVSGFNYAINLSHQHTGHTKLNTNTLTYIHENTPTYN